MFEIIFIIFLIYLFTKYRNKNKYKHNIYKHNTTSTYNKYKSEYDKLLHDDRWYTKRDEILKRDNHRCIICGSTENLQVHHKYYITDINGKRRTPWDYPDEILITLCDSCHKKEHSIIDSNNESILNVNDNVTVNTINEAAKLFNTVPKYNKKGFPICAFDIPNTKNMIVWMPQEKSSSYFNDIINDGYIIHEYPKDTSYRTKFIEQQITKNEVRVTFYKFNNIYKFILLWRNMKAVSCLIMSYLFGCVNPALVISKIKNKDIRESGTGNLGATNTMLNFGKGFGAFVMLFDVFKAVIAIDIAIFLCPTVRLAGLLSGV